MNSVQITKVALNSMRKVKLDHVCSCRANVLLGCTAGDRRSCCQLPRISHYRKRKCAIDDVE